MSLPNLVGICVYALVILACMLAAWAARDKARVARHAGTWLACAAFFLGLALLRLFEIEDRARDTMRHYVRAVGQYEDRALLQIPMAMITLAVTLGLGIYALRAWRSRRGNARERLVLVAVFAVLGFLPLNALRAISWHSTDQILYGGGLHLNWLIDAGLSACVAGCALLYARLRPRVRRPAPANGADGDKGPTGHKT